MSTAYLLLGSNDGDRVKIIESAIERINQLAHVQVSNTSSLYETAAWGKIHLPPHINIAVVVETTLTPADLLSQLLAIELTLGRERQEKWGQRTIDIDIIFFDQDIIETTDLIVPHPLMQQRRFVLVPLNEIIPNYIHPKFQLSVATLLSNSQDELPVEKYIR